MKRVLIACVAVAAFAVPGVAFSAGHARTAASTYTVFLGEFGQPPPAVVKLKLFGSINQFFPSKLVINAGDTVTFSSATFHTVTYVAEAAHRSSSRIRRRARTAISTTPPGDPFYFVGLPKLIYNPVAFGPFGPKTISGKTPASSGVSQPAGPRRAGDRDLHLPEGGVYKLLCTSIRA